MSSNKEQSPKRGEQKTETPTNDVEKALDALKGIVSPKGERGLPYPGDFPNPLPDKYRGCF
ncbi:MAG: hypothetical protein M3081_20565 [Gemmatimonadota bacterium]|nr:hypothetical protein [Gemmatimonadota bacterium]